MNGVCVFNKPPKASTQDHDLESKGKDLQPSAALITAVFIFSREVIGEPIRTLETESFKFVFKSDEEFLFALWVDKLDSEQFCQSLLKVIRMSFYQNFPQAPIQCRTGNMNCFSSFNTPLTNILKVVC